MRGEDRANILIELGFTLNFSYTQILSSFDRIDMTFTGAKKYWHPSLTNTIEMRSL